MLEPELLTENNSAVVLDELTRNFNANLLQAEKVFRNGHANPKTKTQIKNKLQNIKKKQGVGISSIRPTTSTIFGPIAPVRQQKRKESRSSSVFFASVIFVIDLTQQVP